MTTIRLNGKKYFIPSCWEEVTVLQYVQIIRDWEPEKDVADRDFFLLLQILAGVRFKTMQANMENQVTLTNALAWVVAQPFQFSETLPKALFIRGKSVSIPRDPEELSIGQNIHLRRIIDKSNFVQENIAIATAIYLQPILEEKRFHVEQAQALAKELEQMPIHVIYPIGFFLLRRAERFGKMPMGYWHQIRINLSARLSKMWLR
jgi:hypothetical protein